MKRLERYFSSQESECAAVFDLGTRAARLLVGPLPVPDSAGWARHPFFNDGRLTFLGAAVGEHNPRLDLNSRAWKNTVAYVNGFREVLERNGVRPEDTCIVGTAVFRWLENRQEVVEEMQRQTGVPLCVLDDDHEAIYSIFSIASTYSVGRSNTDLEAPDDDTAILLLDQGGGSMEVSYLFPTKRDQWAVDSFENLGTTRLREIFFTLHKDGKVDPTENRRRVSTQNNRVREFIKQEVARWEGYPALQGKRLVAYAMGSAITNCFPNMSNKKVHNRFVTVERMRQLVDEGCSELDHSKQQVRTIYQELQRAEEPAAGPGRRPKKRGRGRDPRDVLDSQLVQLYGLPVYARILEKFGLDRASICGYGLRYGVYVGKYVHGWDPASIQHEGA